MAKSSIVAVASRASQRADGTQQCTSAEHAAEQHREDNASTNYNLSNQCEDAVVVWDDRCDEDEPMAQVLEAIRLALEKETKSRYIRDCDFTREIQRHGMKNAWRVKICRWMFETGKAFDLTVDTVGCAISYMDQFLSVESVDKIMMQLLSLVCVFAASKMHDPEPISLDELSLLCESRFTKQDFCKVEVHLLRILNWELNPPNAFTFARDFVQVLALQDAKEIMESVTELLKFVAEDYGSIGRKASSVALAAVQLIIDSYSPASSPPVSFSPLCMSSSSSSPTSDEFTRALDVVQRVFLSTSPQDECSSQSEEGGQSSPREIGVTSSPIAVENHPHMSVMEDIESLKQMLQAPAVTASSSAQRALFLSPVSTAKVSPRTLKSKQQQKNASSKKRQRAASLSLAH